MGDSAGGGLALALLLRLRDMGAALPGAAVALSPWTDLVMTGKAPQSTPCKSSVDQVIELGNRLSIRGTPTVFFADGRRAQGAVPPDQFMAMFLQAQP